MIDSNEIAEYVKETFEEVFPLHAFVSKQFPDDSWSVFSSKECVAYYSGLSKTWVVKLAGHAESGLDHRDIDLLDHENLKNQLKKAAV